MPSYPTPLTLQAMNVLFQAATIQILGLPQNSNNLVRVDWQTIGQPFQTVSDDVVYIRCVETNDPYDKLREVQYLDNADQTFTQATGYTRVWQVDWTLYGPNAFDGARKVRSALWADWLHDLLAQSNLYWANTDVDAPARVPEFFSGQWRERTDFSAQFNELTVETSTTGIAQSVEIIVQDPAGVLADFTVTKES